MNLPDLHVLAERTSDLIERGFNLNTLPLGQRPMLMEHFESLVLSQKPASTPWQPVTDYSFEFRRAIEGQHPQLIKDVFMPRTAVDAGCGRDGILVKLLAELDVLVMGFDPTIPKQSIDPALSHGSLLDPHFMDGYDGPWADLVICREVFEHLRIVDIRKAVTHLCGLASQFVYVTTRFSSEHDLLRVETSDDLDPTHITIPSKDLIRLLFVLEGFKRRADLEERMDWQHKNRCLVYERAV